MVCAASLQPHTALTTHRAPATWASLLLHPSPQHLFLVFLMPRIFSPLPLLGWLAASQMADLGSNAPPQRGKLRPPEPFPQHTLVGIPVGFFFVCLFTCFLSDSFPVSGQRQHLICYLCIFIPRTKQFWIRFSISISIILSSLSTDSIIQT